MKLSAESESFKGLGTFRLGHFEILITAREATFKKTQICDAYLILSKENLKDLIIS